MWDVIRNLVREGTTLLLTTQYLEEADELADTIAVVDHGKIIAEGTADELKSRVGGERIEVVIHRRDDLPARDRDPRRPHGQRRSRSTTTPAKLTVATGGRREVPRPGRARARRSGHRRWTTSALRRPTLDDVFLSLTGTRRRSKTARRRERQRQGAGMSGTAQTHSGTGSRHAAASARRPRTGC